MASFRGHLSFSAPLGVAYGALALMRHEFDWGACTVGAGVTMIGGMMPDLDSDSGIPVREMFCALAAASAFLVYPPLRENGFTLEQTLVFMTGVYFFIRYVVANYFRRWTVHRGMFHSIPAIFITGLLVYLAYPSRDVYLKLYLAGGMMLGFLSHLILDEIYTVNLMGLRIRFNKFAGSALKFTSPSYRATLATYTILLLLTYVAWEGVPSWLRKPSHRPQPAELTPPVQPANIPADGP